MGFGEDVWKENYTRILYSVFLVCWRAGVLYEQSLDGSCFS